MMICFGKNITVADDRLIKLPLEKLVQAIRSPKQESVSLIRQLRIVHGIDKQQYSRLKRQLPYLVCGHFNPPFRRSENFTCIGNKQAETNIFYGRKGFSVVVSPRTGTDPETNKMISELIQSFFDLNT